MIAETAVPKRHLFGHVITQLMLVVAVSIAVIIITNPDAKIFPRYISLGILIGFLYSNATLSGVFAVLGPVANPFQSFWSRLFASGIWMFSLVFAISMNIAFFHGPSPLIIGFSLLVQWILIAGGLGIFVKTHRLQIARSYDSKSGKRVENSDYQFKISQLLILMTVAAIVFAAGRVILPLFVASAREWPIFAFLAAAQIITTLPLFLAALLRKYAFVALLIAMTQLALGTYYESSLMISLVGGGGGPKLNDFVAINIASAVLILCYALILRVHGYTILLSGRTETTAQCDDESSSADSIFT